MGEPYRGTALTAAVGKRHLHALQEYSAKKTPSTTGWGADRIDDETVFIIQAKTEKDMTSHSD